MKLLCINDKVIETEQPKHNRKIQSLGSNLKAGEIYTTQGKAYKDEFGIDVYYIDGLGARLCCCFTELLEESMVSKKKLEEITLN